VTSRPAGLPHVALAVTALHGVSGGAERVLVDVANGLHRRGYPITVLTYQDRNGPSFYPLDYGIVRLDGRQRHASWRRGAPLAVLAGASRRRRSIAIATWLLQYGPKVYHFRRLLRIARPDVAVGFLPSSFPYLTLAATGTGVRTVASLHNVPRRELGDDPYRWDPNPVDIAIRRRALRTADANTVLLPSFVEQLDERARSKTYVIPNLIHPFTGAKAVVTDDDEDNTILAVGRIAPAKDHATLVRAWARLEQTHPTWRLRIIGTGPLRAELESLIEELELERVTIDEPTSEIEQAYTSAKFLVMSSVHEGFGLVTAEAMACGLPVIGFADCEGTNEIVLDDRNGLLVEPGADRVGALAAAMQQLIENESERVRLGRAAPASIHQFRPEPVIDAWERMIQDVYHGTVAR
jgi:glycosyltransferase involved in cell wall biosynthesis